MSRLTHHAKRRMEERGNITHDQDAKRNADKALQNGIKHSETSGELKKYYDALFFKERNATNVRIYRGYVYLFNGGNLITFFKVPERFLCMLDHYVPEAVYKRYCRFTDDKIKRKSRELDKREKEKWDSLRNEFWSRVIIDDIEENIPKLPAKIIRVIVDDNSVIQIRYVSKRKKGTRPDKLMDYIRENYLFKFIYMKHIKDENGEPIVIGKNEPKEETDSEIVYSSGEDEKDDPSSGTLGELLKGIVLPE